MSQVTKRRNCEGFEPQTPTMEAQSPNHSAIKSLLKVWGQYPRTSSSMMTSTWSPCYVTSSSTAQLWSPLRRLLVRKWSKRFQQMLQQSDRGPTWHRHNSQPYHRLHNIEDTHTEPWKNISGARVIWLCSCSRVTQVAQSKCLHAPWRHIILGVLWHFILGHIVDSVKYRHLSKL